MAQTRKTLAEWAASFSEPRRQRFLELYALKEFVTESVIPTEFRAPDELAKAIVPTPSGIDLLEHGERACPGVQLADRLLSLLALFGTDELLIDLERTDVLTVSKVVSDCFSSQRLLLPWTYGRLLYDRFFEMGLNEQDELEYEPTLELLRGTPGGVAQLGQLVLGPLGVTSSAESRWLPPRRSAVLWHCSEIGCQAIHDCELGTGTSQTFAFNQALGFELMERRVQSVPWAGIFRELVDFGYYDDLTANDLPYLLVNALSPGERQRLLHQLGGEEDGRRASGDPGEAETFQLLLAATDADLARSIDQLVRSGLIRVPDAERRRSAMGSGGVDMLTSEAQLSKLGLRFVPVRVPIGIARLRALIKWIFSGPDEDQRLAWYLRRVEGSDTASRLDRYLETSEPRDVVREVVLSTRDSLDRAVAFLRYGDFDFDLTPQGEDTLVDRLLWKVGFDVNVYPKSLVRLYDRLRLLQQAAGDASSEDQLRSAATNLFVSLEELLDQGLSFSTWALWSDHPRDTLFEYNPDVARSFAAEFLNSNDALRTRKNQPVKFNADGRNTLWPLVEGFAALAGLNERLAPEKSAHRRPSASLPGYAGKSKTVHFPWLHSVAYYDLSTTGVQAFNDHLRWITKRLNDAAVGDVRNRTGHERRDFPSGDELLLAAAAIQDVTASMESVGSVPLVRYVARQTRDRYNRTVSGMVDYAGRTLELRSETVVVYNPWPQLRQPTVVIPSLYISGMDQPLRFAYRENSEFTEMWSNYPKRRPVPRDESALVQELAEEVGVVATTK